MILFIQPSVAQDRFLDEEPSTGGEATASDTKLTATKRPIVNVIDPLHVEEVEGGEFNADGSAKDPQYGVQYPLNSTAKDVVIICVNVCLLVSILIIIAYCVRKARRKKFDIEAHLAVGLAKINNMDVEKRKRGKAIMGVGTNTINVEEWIRDIYFTYDRDRGGELDRSEFKKFVDHTLKVA